MSKFILNTIGNKTYVQLRTPVGNATVAELEGDTLTLGKYPMAPNWHARDLTQVEVDMILDLLNFDAA
jgi:hypothetical protein